MSDNLWNELQEDSSYIKNPELLQSHILEQYKMYVEMADRISSRRNLANVFFLTLNTSVLSAIGLSFNKLDTMVAYYWLTLPFVCLIILCIVWWWIIRSYRNLNSAKFKVIGQLESKLPASPYWNAEWNELGKGKDLRKYLPLTVLENSVPIVFILLYITILIAQF